MDRQYEVLLAGSRAATLLGYLLDNGKVPREHRNHAEEIITEYRDADARWHSREREDQILVRGDRVRYTERACDSESLRARVGERYIGRHLRGTVVAMTPEGVYVSFDGLPCARYIARSMLVREAA